MLTLITGGSGSGKSEYAEAVATTLFAQKKAPKGKLYYLATMLSFDKETDKRIERHRSMREGKGFSTLECPRNIATLSLQKQDVVLLECLSNLLANEMFGEECKEGEALLQDLDAFLSSVEDVVIVTNEIFSDVETYEESTENYRYNLGFLNRELAKRADCVVQVVCGIPVCVKGESPC